MKSIGRWQMLVIAKEEFARKSNKNDPIELVIPLGKLLVKVYFKDKLWTYPHITVEEIHIVRALPG